MLPKINHVFRLVKDPETRFTATGLAVTSLYLVAGERYKEKETNCWISATAFGKTGELIGNCKKGDRVFITGKIQTEEWESNGQKNSKISLIVDGFDYIEKKTGEASRQDWQKTVQPSADPAFEEDRDIPF